MCTVIRTSLQHPQYVSNIFPFIINSLRAKLPYEYINIVRMILDGIVFSPPVVHS